MMADDPFSRHRAFISPASPSPSPSASFSGDRRSSFSSPRPQPIPLRPSPSSSASRHSLTPSTFAHNSRLAVALVPAALFLLDLGGSPVFTILTLGLAAAYFFDSVKFSIPSFLSIWVALVLSQVAFFFSSSPSLSLASLPLTALSLLLCAETTFLIGVWASVNFRWIQIEHPAIAIALERLLFACVPVTVPPLFTWAVISAVGMANSSYYFLAFSCLFYWIFSIPRPSSFKKGNSEPSILAQLESCLHSLYILFLPLLFHISSHHSTIFSSLSSFCDLLLLFFLPFLFQLYTSTRGTLWWVSTNPHHIRQIQIVNGSIAVVILTLCLEIRVIFHSFGRYIHVPPPLNYVLVTISMLGGAAGLGAHMSGMVKDSVSSAVFTTVTVLVSAVGAIVLGFPIPFIPLPMICGFFLSRFFTQKSLSSYFAFVALSTLMVLWFVTHHFWDLNIWLAAMPLKSFTKYLVFSVMLAMSVPGLVLLPLKFKFLTEVGLVMHAVTLCWLEDKLFNHASMYYFGYDEEVIYPSYMVLVTTVLGVGIVRRGEAEGRIGSKAGWILMCLYGGKLAMLVVVGKSVVWVATVLLLAVTPPLLLYKDKVKGGSKMKPWQAYTHATIITISAWVCRETIFQALQFINGRPPSDGLLLGSFILLTGIACLPIVALHFPHSQPAKKSLILIISTGLLLLTLQPPLSLSWAFNSNLIQSSHQSNDDTSIYGYASSAGPTWPSWLLILTLILSLASFCSIIPIKYISELRALYSLTVGLSLGIYISVQYFYGAVILYPLLISAVICASVFVVFTHLPSASSTKILPWVFALLVALLPVTYLLEGQLRAKGIFGINTEGGDETEQSLQYQFSTILAIQGAKMSLLGLYAAIFMLISLVIKFDLSALLHEKSLTGQTGRPKTRLFQQRRTAGNPSLTIKRLSAEAAWMPLIGNISTILCFIICLILNISLTGGSNRAIFLLAPILLLLNQDSDIISTFGDRQRYFPVTIVISTYLVLLSLYRIFEEVFWTGGEFLFVGGPGWFFAVKNLALLMLTLPNHILFNRFMWDYVKQSDAVLLLTLPLNLPSVVITDVLGIRVLGLLGGIYSLAQYLISRRVRIAGMKYI